MTDVQPVVEVAKGISEHGMMAITTAFYLVLTAIMMITMFKWFKAIINKILDDYRKSSNAQQDHWKTLMEDYKKSISDQQDKWQALFTETQKQNEKLDGLVEGLRPETQLRIRNLTGFAFDLSIEQVCRIIKKVREENHIIDHEATQKKIRLLLNNIHEDRNSRFDTFTYKGEKLSKYCNPEWVELVAGIVEGEIYHEDGPNNGRAFTNVKAAYDNIRTEFYHNLNQ